MSESFTLDVSFTASSGITMLFGASGAGKTTLLECISGLLAPDAGRVAVRERVLFDGEMRVNVPVARRRVAYVFQTLALFPHMSVEANIAYGIDRLPAEECRKAVDAIVDAFRIRHLRHRQPGEISGGERQTARPGPAPVAGPGNGSPTRSRRPVHSPRDRARRWRPDQPGTPDGSSSLPLERALEHRVQFAPQVVEIAVTKGLWQQLLDHRFEVGQRADGAQRRSLGGP